MLVVHVAKVEFRLVGNFLLGGKIQAGTKSRVYREPTVAFKIHFCPPVVARGCVVFHKYSANRECRYSSCTAKGCKHYGKIVCIAVLLLQHVKDCYVSCPYFLVDRKVFY